MSEGFNINGAREAFKNKSADEHKWNTCVCTQLSGSDCEIKEV